MLFAATTCLLFFALSAVSFCLTMYFASRRQIYTTVLFGLNYYMNATVSGSALVSLRHSLGG